MGFERDEYITTEHNGSVEICAVLYPTNTPGANFTLTLVLLEGNWHKLCMSCRLPSLCVACSIFYFRLRFFH